MHNDLFGELSNLWLKGQLSDKYDVKKTYHPCSLRHNDRNAELVVGNAYEDRSYDAQNGKDTLDILDVDSIHLFRFAMELVDNRALD